MRLSKRKTSYSIVGVSILLMLLVLVLAQGGLRTNPAVLFCLRSRRIPGIAEMLVPRKELGRGPDHAGYGTACHQHTFATGYLQPERRRVETFWSGGSGTSVSQVSVSGGRTRIDTPLPDGSICHMLVIGGSAAVWYDDETTWTVSDCGAVHCGYCPADADL